MGEVFLARKDPPAPLVAIKVLPPSVTGDPEALARFQAECRALSEIRHPHVCKVFDVGHDASRDLHYYVMEYLPGRSLDFVMATQRMDAFRAAEILRQVAQALSAVHRRGLIHRDVKPLNIMLVRTDRPRARRAPPPTRRPFAGLFGRISRREPATRANVDSSLLRDALTDLPELVVELPDDADPSLEELERDHWPSPEFEDHAILIDFGLVLAEGQQQLTAPDVLMGTLFYMAPEQARAARSEIGPRTDLYSAGVILYELLTGRTPNRGSDTAQTLEKIQNEDPVRPRALRPDVPHDLETIVLRCLEKDPARRYATAQDLAEDLRRFLADDEILARPPGRFRRLARKLRRHRVPLGIAGAMSALLLLVVLHFTVFARWRHLGRQRDALRQLAGERAALEDEVRRGYAQAVRDGDAEAAGRVIAKAEPWFGQRPDLSGIPDWETLRKEPGFAPLAGTADLPLPELHLLRARALSGRPEDARGVADLARAYSRGLADTRPGGRSAGAEALFEIGVRLAAKGLHDRAAGAFEILLDRFPESPLAGESRVNLARALEALGRLGEAREAYEGVIGRAAVGSAARREAEQAVALLRPLFPASTWAVPSGKLVAADLDGDGREEIAVADPKGRLAVFRWDGDGLFPFAETALDAEYRDLGTYLAALDLTGDGRPELVTAQGDTHRGRGRVQVFRWKDGALAAGPAATVQSFLYAAAAADLDGDGTIELLAAVGYDQREIRVYGLGGGSELVLKGTYASSADPALRSDPLDLLPVELDGRPGREVLISWGPWNGWKVGLYRWSPRLGQLSLAGEPQARGTYTGFRALDEGRVLCTTSVGAHELGPLREILRVPEQGLVPNGVCTLKLGADGSVEEPQPLAQAPFPDREWTPGRAVPLRNRSLRGLAYSRNRGKTRLVHVAALDESPSRPHLIEVSEALDIATAADLDGDGEDELILSEERASHQRLKVLGAGKAPERAPRPRPLSGSDGEPDAGNDLLALGFFREAEEEFRRRMREFGEGAVPEFLWVGLARSLAEQRRFAEAAGALERGLERSPERSPRLVQECAELQERARLWKSLARTCQLLTQDLRLDPVGRAEAERRRQWAAEAAGIMERERVDRPGAGTPFECDNPILIRGTAEGLEVVHPSFSGNGGGIPVRYAGGPFRLEWEMCLPRLDWGSSLSFGLEGPCRLEVLVSAGGSSNLPVVGTALLWSAPDGQSGEVHLPNGTVKPDAGRWWKVAVEYVPGAGRAWLTFHDGREEHGAECAVPRPLDHGVYRFGKLARAEEPRQNEYYGRAVFRSLRVSAYDPSMRLEEPPPPATAPEWLRAAGGDHALGRLDRALHRYGRAIEQARQTGDVSIRGRAHFFSALLCLRRGDPDGGRGHLRSALAASAAEVHQLARRCLPALTPAELQFLEGR